MLDAIILAGGRGRRMECETPKPLVIVKGKPLIFHQLDYLKDKVGKISISAGYGADSIIKSISSTYKTNDKIYFAIEEEPLGTAGGIRNAFSKINSKAAVVLN